MSAPDLWSAERPNLYSLTVELLDGEHEVVEIVSTRVGFREIDLVDPALLVNGHAVKLNAVNSHVHHPETGRAMDLQTMRRDLVLMKRFNVNAVRTSHYPPNVEYLDLADELGVYVIDETNDEAHATTQLSELPEWQAQYVNRARRMVLRDRNHPSIVMWSAGNESGSGENICALIAEGKRLDPSRPAWMYGGNNDYFPGNSPLGVEVDVVRNGHSQIKQSMYDRPTRFGAVEESAHFYEAFDRGGGRRFCTENTVYMALLAARIWKDDLERVEELIEVQRSTARAREWGYKFPSEGGRAAALAAVREHFEARGAASIERMRGGMSLDATLMRRGLPFSIDSTTRPAGDWLQVCQRRSQSEDGLARGEVVGAERGMVQEAKEAIAQCVARFDAGEEYEG